MNQIQLNREAYQKLKNKLEAEHPGRYALMHDGEMIEIYNDSGDAYSIGCDKYGLGSFTIEEIGERPISLGIFTTCLENHPR